MSAAKAGLLAFILVTPFGLAGYEDFVNDGPIFGGSTEARDAARLDADNTYVTYDDFDPAQDHGLNLDPAPEPDIYDSPLGTLVITLGDQPEILAPDAFDGLGGIDGLVVAAVPGAEKDASGLDLRWSDPEVRSEELLDDAWGASEQYTAVSGGEHLFWFNAGFQDVDTGDIPVAVRAMLRRGIDNSPAMVSLELRKIRSAYGLVFWLGRYLGKPAAKLAKTIDVEASDNPMVYVDTLATEMAREPTEIRVYHRQRKADETSPRVDFIERIVISTDYALDRGYVDRFAEALANRFGEADTQVENDSIVRTFSAKYKGVLIRRSGSVVLKDTPKNHRLTVDLTVDLTR